MDITFNCVHCGQELEVDSEAAGTVFPCPSCNNDIAVPSGFEETEEAAAPAPPPAAAAPIPIPPKPATQTEEEKAKLAVPFSAEKTKELIQKPTKPLEVAAREDDKVFRIKTFRHADCVELDRDTFDQTVSDFIQKVDQDHIVAMHPISYSVVDSVSQKITTDYGLIIIFRG